MNRKTGHIDTGVSGFWLLAFGLWLMAALPVSAQKQWTIDDCLLYALQNNITLQKARLQLLTATEDVKGQQAAVQKTARNIVPNLVGMGARDAVYQLESRGIRARVRGRGKVRSQSIFAGTAVKQGMVCDLMMD